MAYDLLRSATTTSVCSICHAAVDQGSEYLRQGYDGRHINCHEGLTAAIQAAATAYINKAMAATAKAKTQVKYPTDADQRALYAAAKKANTLDAVVKTGRQAPATKAEGKGKAKTEAEAPAKATKPKDPEADAGATWDKRKARLDQALELNRLTAEEHSAAVAKLGARPQAVTA
jgi:hypothetical protein